jgi:hypothetical protein
MPPLFPLPDYPRRAPSTISTIACRLLEDKDVTALPPLTDALRDAGRESDAVSVERVIASHASTFLSRPNEASGTWLRMRYEILNLLFWDIFDITLMCGVLDKRLKDVKPWKPGPTSDDIVTSANLNAHGVHEFRHRLQ